MQLNRDELLRAYRSMSTIRRFEERVQEEFSKGGIPGFVHLYAGEEASAVGMCMHLGPGDYIASTHRGHGHSIAKGCDVTGMMHELFAKHDGLCGGKGGSMHIADLNVGMLGANGIVGGGPPLVVGAALTAKTLGNGGVAVCFSGDGASNQGTTFEALNMAVVLKLPAVFVFENNQYGEAAYEAVERARGGGGPSVIEVDTCRFYGHHSGDAQLYRGKDEVKGLRENRDCLKHFRSRVLEAALLEPDALDTVDAEVASLIDQAIADARAASPPDASQLLTDVYVSY
jgi:TPP-dependent pyruvate/acetoin dehydrogenase alpha subunit